MDLPFEVDADYRIPPDMVGLVRRYRVATIESGLRRRPPLWFLAVPGDTDAVLRLHDSLTRRTPRSPILDRHVIELGG